MIEQTPESVAPLKLKILREKARDALMAARLRSDLSDTAVTHALEALEEGLLAPLPPAVQRAVRGRQSTADENVRAAAANALRSPKILRFEPVSNWTREKNTDPETVFEKNLANEIQAAGNAESWATAIPIWSGMCWGKKANIDIGYRDAAGRFVLCELKIASNDPLYAVMELSTYIVGYLVVRKLARFLSAAAYEAIRARSRDLLTARSVDWCVLAPALYYENAIERSGGKSLVLAELNQIRACAQSYFSAAAQRFGISDLDLTVSLRSFACGLPPKKPVEVQAMEEWVRAIRGTSTLPNLILEAPSI